MINRQEKEESSVPNARVQEHSGFTIVELLIVIVVIAILAAISVVAYGGMRDRANNAKRRSDIAQMQKAIELSYADNGRYPVVQGIGASVFTCISAVNWDCWGSYGENRLVSTEYSASIPQDPQILDSSPCNFPNQHLSRMYAYQTNAAGSGYLLATYMPGLSASDPNYFDGSTNIGCLNFANFVIRRNM